MNSPSAKRVDPASIPVDEMPLLGEPFTVEFANTRDVGERENVDFLEHEAAVRTWFAHAPAAYDLAVPSALSAANAAALRDIRDATRLLLTELADGGRALSTTAADALNAASRRAPGHLALEVGHGGRPTWELAHDGAPADVFVASVAARCILFLAGDDAGGVRRCARPACPLLFVQRHRARRFCSEHCAHSVRQARYYRATKRARQGE
jgi:predicted RNA-binding Zn ribbon-like protein